VAPLELELELVELVELLEALELVEPLEVLELVEPLELLELAPPPEPPELVVPLELAPPVLVDPALAPPVVPPPPEPAPPLPLLPPAAPAPDVALPDERAPELPQANDPADKATMNAAGPRCLDFIMGSFSCLALRARRRAPYKSAPIESHAHLASSSCLNIAITTRSCAGKSSGVGDSKWMSRACSARR
jgi:zinc finger protein PLAGL1